MADADFASIVRAHTETATIAWKTHHDAGRPNNTLKAWTNLTASLGPSITNDGAVEAAMSIISVKLKEAAESFDGGPRAIADIISYLRPTLDRIRKRLNEHVHGPADVSLPVMVPSVVNPDDRMTRRSGRREASATEVKELPPATHLTPTQQQLYDKLLGAEAARADFYAARLSRARRGLVSPDDATTAFSLANAVTQLWEEFTATVNPQAPIEALTLERTALSAALLEVPTAASVSPPLNASNTGCPPEGSVPVLALPPAPSTTETLLRTVVQHSTNVATPHELNASMLCDSSSSAVAVGSSVAACTRLGAAPPSSTNTSVQPAPHSSSTNTQTSFVGVLGSLSAPGKKGAFAVLERNMTRARDPVS